MAPTPDKPTAAFTLVIAVLAGCRPAAARPARGIGGAALPGAQHATQWWARWFPPNLMARMTGRIP